MNTFLPYPDFKLSAAVLDRQRLGKQRPEVIQLLRALDDPTDKIHRHPACIMWWGFRDALVSYGLAICDEWISRGYHDDSWRKIRAFSSITEDPLQQNVTLPKWFGDSAFHASHRSNLLRKDYKWYSAFGWKDSPLLPYVWPTNRDPRLFRMCLTK